MIPGLLKLYPIYCLTGGERAGFGLKTVTDTTEYSPSRTSTFLMYEVSAHSFEWRTRYMPGGTLKKA